jgi:hypothetical protein
MNRAQLLATLSSAVALASCSSSSIGRAVAPSARSNSARPIEIATSIRRKMQFPQARPDRGSIPSRANYVAKAHSTATVRGAITPQVINPICTQDTCGGGGGGGYDGTEPDLQMNSGPETGYYWDAQNYVETWTADGATLLSQAYWSHDATSNTFSLTMNADTGDSVVATGPAWYDDGTYSINGGAATLVLSTANGTVNLYHQNGLRFSGVSDGTNLTLTSSQNGTSVSATVALTDIAPYASVGRQTMGERHTDANIHCVAIALIGLAIMLAILAVAMAMIEAICVGSGGMLCAVAGLLIAAMAERALKGVRDWVRSQGCA